MINCRINKKMNKKAETGKMKRTPPKQRLVPKKKEMPIPG